MSIEIKKRIGLGQTIFKFELSNKFISTINNKVDDDLKLGQAIDASDSLSAKIVREYHILHHLPTLDVDGEVDDCISAVLNETPYDDKFKIKEVNVIAAWVNDQRKHEYQVVHIHSGNIQTGFSSILYLRTLEDYGKELQHPWMPCIGRTELISNGGGMFSIPSVRVTPKVGDFYIFPYDMQHMVYPFSSEGTRRSMSINFDVYFEKDENSLASTQIDSPY